MLLYWPYGKKWINTFIFLETTNILCCELSELIEEYCARIACQGQGQVFTSYRYWGMCLLGLADICLYTKIAKFMGPTWGRQDPGGPHVGPWNFAILVFIVQILIQVIIIIISKREQLNLVGHIFVLHPCFFYKFVYNIYKFLMLETPCNKSATRSTMIYWCFSLVCWAHPLLDQPNALPWWQNNLTSLTFNIESVVFALIQLHVNNWRD